jgi:hypothetical protein
MSFEKYAMCHAIRVVKSAQFWCNSGQTYSGFSDNFYILLKALSQKTDYLRRVIRCKEGTFKSQREEADLMFALSIQINGLINEVIDHAAIEVDDEDNDIETQVSFEVAGDYDKKYESILVNLPPVGNFPESVEDSDSSDSESDDNDYIVPKHQNPLMSRKNVRRFGKENRFKSGERINDWITNMRNIRNRKAKLVWDDTSRPAERSSFRSSVRFNVVERLIKQDDVVDLSGPVPVFNWVTTSVV